MHAMGKGTWAPVEVIWPNPPTPNAGFTLRRRMGGRVWETKVGPRGLLTVAETASALILSPVHVYRLVKNGQLRAVTSTRAFAGRQRPSLRFPVSTVFAFNRARAARRGARGETQLTKPGRKNPPASPKGARGLWARNRRTGEPFLSG